MDLAKSIRVGLARKNESKRWLASKLDVSPQFVSSLCNGGKSPSSQMIQDISDAFGVPASEFIKWGEL